MTRLRPPLALFAVTLLLLAGPAPAQEPTTQPVALTNGTLVDGTGAAPMPGMTLLIRDGRIDALFPTGERPLPDDATVHDLTGRTVIPGLIESHTHLQDFAGSRERLLWEMERQLYGGVVAIREMAGDARVSAELARAAALGEVASPDIYFSAVMMGPHFFSMDASHAGAVTRGAARPPAWVQAVTGDTDVRLAVARAAGTGATGLKLYIEMEPELVAAITAEAHRQGLKVWAHPAVFPSRPLEVVRAGVDGISHLCGLAWQDATLDTRRYARVSRTNRPAFDPADIEPDGPEMRMLLEEMARRGTFLDATFSAYLRGPSGFGCERGLMAAIGRAAHDTGVRFLAGTDWHAPPDSTYPGLHQEIIALVEHDILSPLEAITAATRNPAMALGIDDRTGTIEVGKSADLVILDSDPLESIEAIRRVHATLRRGVLYPRADYERRRAEEGTTWN